MMKTALIFFLFLGCTSALACRCVEIKDIKKAQEANFQRHNLIFIGAVVEELELGDYKIEIVELLKGDVNNKVISGQAKTSCSLRPKANDGLWLVYVNFNEGNPIDIEMCGLSRPFSNPYFNTKSIKVDISVAKAESDTTMYEVDKNLVRIKYFEQALGILREEIYELRKRRDA